MFLPSAHFKITDFRFLVILVVFAKKSSIFDDFVSFVIFDKTANSKKNDSMFLPSAHFKITDLGILVILVVFDHFLIIFDDFVSFVKTTNF